MTTETDGSIAGGCSQSVNRHHKVTPAIALALGGALAANLVLYTVGRYAGGTYRYRQNGEAARVDAVAIAVLTVVPLAAGLALAALLSRKWPKIVNAAQVLAPVLALATIAPMTVPAHFDTTSTLCLAATHVAVIPFAIVALRTLTAFSPW